MGYFYALIGNNSRKNLAKARIPTLELFHQITLLNLISVKLGFVFFSAPTPVGALFLYIKIFFKGGVNMQELDMVELLYYEYMDYCCANGKMLTDPEGVKAFNKKYVYPLLEENSEEGEKMEVMFNRALADIDIQGFKNGFKACMNLITNCFNNEAEI